tara:strand:- start:499 stop:1566 length:1068 start_codon:yes stop_codon:yes gene_type:complete
MTEYEICVLVTGVGGGSLGRELIKTLQHAKTKYRIIATDMARLRTGLFETSSSYITPKAESENYIPTILKICKKEDVKIIIPGSEAEIKEIVENKQKFEDEKIQVLANSLDIIQKCSDKFEMVELLEKEGFVCPKTLLCENMLELKKIKKFPVIVKPRKGSGSQNVFIAHDLEEAEFFFKYLKKYSIEPLIQEYVGSHTEEYTVGVLYADNGKLKTSIAMRRMLEGSLSVRQMTKDPKNKKKFLVSTGISQGFFDDFKQVRKIGEDIAKALDVNGPINIQCRKTESEIIPFEINPRFSGTIVGRMLAGYNEPDIFCRYKLFNEIPKNEPYEIGYVLRDLKERFYPINEINKIPEA